MDPLDYEAKHELDMKKALKRILFTGIPVLALCSFFIIPAVISNFKEHDYDAGVALIIMLAGVFIIFAGVLVSTVVKIKKIQEKIEFGLD